MFIQNSFIFIIPSFLFLCFIYALFKSFIPVLFLRSLFLTFSQIFYEYETGNVLGTLEAQCTTEMLWSPDSNFICCAIYTPRMRVDNGLKLVLPNGDVIAEKPIDELYKATWRPMPGATFVKRPLPKPKQLTAAELKAKQESEHMHGTYIGALAVRFLETRDIIDACKYASVASILTRSTFGCLDHVPTQAEIEEFTAE